MLNGIDVRYCRTDRPDCRRSVDCGDRERDVPRRTLGHTGESVSCIGLGGFHIGKPKLSDSEPLASSVKPWIAG